MSAGGVIWAASISDNDVFNILKKASVFVGMIMDFQSASEIEDCNKVTSQFCSLMEEGEKAGRGKVVTRILYDMFLMVFRLRVKPSTLSTAGASVYYKVRNRDDLSYCDWSIQTMRANDFEPWLIMQCVF